MESQDGLDKIVADNSVDIVIVAIHRRMEESLLTEMVNSIPRRVKLYTMPEEIRCKIQKTLQKIINEGSSNIITILL